VSDQIILSGTIHGQQITDAALNRSDLMQKIGEEYKE
jgi:hypothetical protein